MQTLVYWSKILSIVDLHCDLLLYLSAGNRSPNDQKVRCSIPALLAGNVELQILALFSDTQSGAIKKIEKQLEVYLSLQPPEPLHFVLAVENAHGFSEDEPLDWALQRLRQWQSRFGLAYVSLTWNERNRFGGGALDPAGLTDEGKVLLRELSTLGIALDLSHASDILAWDILRLVDTEDLSLPLMASHSNLRKVQAHPRNLPDALAAEIIGRKGIIGLNFVRPFVGASSADLRRHVDHVLDLGGEDALCFGADFFYSEDSPSRYGGSLFFQDMGTSAQYPRDFPEKMYRDNALRFFEDRLCKTH